MLRFVPPAGTPLKSRQLLAALRHAASLKEQESQALAPLTSLLDVRYTLGASSGRAALWTILRGLRRIHPQSDVVALPAYTCFSVAAAVVRAGLTLYPLDIDPNSLDFDRAQLDDLPEKNLLCIITANLFGFVNDMGPLHEAARARNAFLVDDAAQALGARREGRMAGTMADVGLYSLGRGKALTTLQGGLIVTSRSDIAQAIHQEAAQVQPCSWLDGPRLLLQLLAYSVFLRPSLYRIPSSMPFLHLGATEFNPRFAVRKLHPLSRSLLLVLLDTLGTMNEIRRANARSIAESLTGHPKFHVPSPGPLTEPTMVRLPVIAGDETTRSRAVTLLHQAGIGASAFYPSAICDIPGIERHMANSNCHREKAEHLSRTLFTLPVHPYVQQRDIERMVGILDALQVEDGREDAVCQASFSAKRA
jgi:dTDP-4-amino-4,6-dideoxygalactose transaminase